MKTLLFAALILLASGSIAGGQKPGPASKPVAPVAAPPAEAAALQKPEDILKNAGPVPPEHVEKLKEYKKYASDPDVRVRSDQQERLSVVDHPEAAKLLIESGLRDDAYRVHERAAWALSRHKSAASIAYARALFKSGTEEIKMGCAIALSKMTPKPAGAAAEVAAALSAGPKERLKIA